MNELTLTRSRSKHPASKVAAEREKITSRVVKSESKRRKNMTSTKTQKMIENGWSWTLTAGGDPEWRYVGEEQARKDEAIRQKLTADLPKMEAFINSLDVEAAINGTGTEEMRLSGSRILAASATEREEQGDGDFGTALREVVKTSSVVTPEQYGSNRPERDEEDAPVRRLGEVYGTDEEMREAVERKMKLDKENYRD